MGGVGVMVVVLVVVNPIIYGIKYLLFGLQAGTSQEMNWLGKHWYDSTHRDVYASLLLSISQIGYEEMVRKC